jgi:hypothetical protein
VVLGAAAFGISGRVTGSPTYPLDAIGLGASRLGAPATTWIGTDRQRRRRSSSMELVEAGERIRAVADHGDVCGTLLGRKVALPGDSSVQGA